MPLPPALIRGVYSEEVAVPFTEVELIKLKTG